VGGVKLGEGGERWCRLRSMCDTGRRRRCRSGSTGLGGPLGGRWGAAGSSVGATFVVEVGEWIRV
jgi:hypothetical protein